MNISFCFYKTNRHTGIENRLVVAKGRGWVGEILGVCDLQMQAIIYRGGKTTKSYYIAQGTIFNIL